MNTSNPTKKQHFVPRFYLKNFADKKGYLQVLDIKEKRMATPRPYQGLGYAYYYYALKTGAPDTISQQIEEWFKPMEDFIAKELPRIIKAIENQQHIEEWDRYIIALLMSMLWLRTPGMRNQIQAMNEDLVKKIERLRGAGSVKKLKSKDNKDHLRFMVNSVGFGEPGFTNKFLNMKWTAYLAQGREHFITTDSPIVEKWLPPKGFYSAPFKKRDKYFALTPTILLHLTYPVGSTKLKRKTLYENQNDKARTLNLILISGAQEYAYSEREKEPEQLLEGRKNPRSLELAYFNKYEKPWEEWRARKEK